MLKHVGWILSFMLIILVRPAFFAQEIAVFYVIPFEKEANQTVGFISMSDVYALSENPDSAAIPPMEEVGIEQASFFYLDSIYRKRFLEGTHIRPNDSVFIYNYVNHLSASFSVTSLKVLAKLNDYRTDDDWPHDPYDYQIGFEIPTADWKRLNRNYSTPLVCIGKSNPFVKGQMKPLVWTKIPDKEFPLSAIDTSDGRSLRNVKRGTAYRASSNGFHVYVQDILSSENGNLAARHCIVTDRKTSSVVRNDCFYDSESTLPTPLNLMTPEKMINQFEGQLFKGKPPVILGFEYVSFGCEKIMFLLKEHSPIYINCDNRH